MCALETHVEALKLKIDNGGVLPRNVDFARSLCGQFDERGTLSDKQVYWVKRFLDTEPEEPPRGEYLGSTDTLFAMFSTAAGKLKFPAFELTDAAGRAIRVHIAGERARFPGSMTIGAPKTAGRTWYGRLHTNGTLELSENADDDVRDLIAALTLEPHQTVADHGHKTGHCCFCHVALTDERSLVAGYGPICAKNWNLPWGAAA